MSLTVIDNATSPELCERFRTWLQGQTLIYGWKASRKSPGKFWHRNYVLPGMHKHHYDDEAVSSDLTFELLMTMNTPLSEVAKMVSDTFFNGKPLSRVWVNVQAFGDEGAIHTDFPIEYKGDARSVVWYPVQDWDADWGGDFCLFDDNREITAAATVKPDRMVTFDGTSMHAVRPLSRYSDGIRIAVAFGLETQKQ